MIQDDFYTALEADSFFSRNEPGTTESFPRVSKEEIRKFINDSVKLESGDQVLEIGCFIGDLLADYKSAGQVVYGIEPSGKACDFAKSQFGIELENTALSNSELFGFDPENEARFKLIILDDVLGWIDRRRILPSLATVDWLTAENGYVFFRELYSDFPYAVSNHHHPGEDIRNYRHAHGHHQLLMATGRYAVVKMFVRSTTQFQKVGTQWHQAIWADTLLKKLTTDTIPSVSL